MSGETPVLFHEKQRFRQWWVWVMFVGILAILLAFYVPPISDRLRAAGGTRPGDRSHCEVNLVGVRASVWEPTPGLSREEPPRMPGQTNRVSLARKRAVPRGFFR